VSDDTDSVEKLSHEEIKRRTWPNQSGFGASPMRQMSTALPLMAMMMGGIDSFGIPSVIKKPSKELKKCALPGCEVMFLPEKESQCCCSKEHFLELRKLQKEKK
jgi:hypothetical protein